jgi:hypothetical protein
VESAGTASARLAKWFTVAAWPTARTPLGGRRHRPMFASLRVRGRNARRTRARGIEAGRGASAARPSSGARPDAFQGCSVPSRSSPDTPSSPEATAADSRLRHSGVSGDYGSARARRRLAPLRAAAPRVPVRAGTRRRIVWRSRLLGERLQVPLNGIARWSTVWSTGAGFGRRRAAVWGLRTRRGLASARCVVDGTRCRAFKSYRRNQIGRWSGSSGSVSTRRAFASKGGQ